MVVGVPPAAVDDLCDAALDNATEIVRRCQCLIGAVLLGNIAVGDGAARTRGLKCEARAYITGPAACQSVSHTGEYSVTIAAQLDRTGGIGGRVSRLACWSARFTSGQLVA